MTNPNPPPRSTPPTTLTPGHRAQALLTLHDQTLAATLRALSYPSFSACFPTIAANAPTALSSMHSDFVAKLQRYASEEFEEILHERGVIAGLNGLEGVLSEGKRRKKDHGKDVKGGDGMEGVVAPHTLPPPILLSAHLDPIYTSQNSQLNARIQTQSSQNAMLMGDIARQRGDIERWMGVLRGMVEDVEGANWSLGKEVGELVKEGVGGEGLLGGY